MAAEASIQKMGTQKLHRKKRGLGGWDDEVSPRGKLAYPWGRGRVGRGIRVRGSFHAEVRAGEARGG